MSRHVSDMHTTCPDFDEEEDVERLQANGFEREEITRQLGASVVIEEGSPGRGEV